MEYKVTSDNPHSVVYIGVRVTTSNERLRTLVHDRELEYPYHIVRYPEWSSTAPRTQLGGIIFGCFWTLGIVLLVEYIAAARRDDLKTAGKAA